jgi:hypothetical protein
MSGKRTKRSGKQPKEPKFKFQRQSDIDNYPLPTNFKIIVRDKLRPLLSNASRGRELSDEEKQYKFNIAFDFVDSEEVQAEKMKKMSQQARKFYLSEGCILVVKYQGLVDDIWNEMLQETHAETQMMPIKQEMPSAVQITRNTTLEEYYPHDDTIFDELNTEHNNSVKLKEDRPTTSKPDSAGDLIVTDEVEPVGCMGVYINGFKGLPLEIQEIKSKEFERQERNGFVKPDLGFVTANDKDTECPEFGQCKICYWCSRGFLGMSLKTIKKLNLNDNDFNSAINKDVSKAAMIGASRFRSKYYELKDNFSPEYACKVLAEIWNNRINYMRQKYSEEMTFAQHTQSIDDFVMMMDDFKTSSMHDKSIFAFTRSMTKSTKEKDREEEDEDDLEEIVIDERRIYRFLPPTVDVDDFLYHFKKCIKTDIREIVLDQLHDTKTKVEFIGNNCVFKRIGSGPIDDEQSAPSTSLSETVELDHKSAWIWLNGIDRVCKLATTYRQLEQDDRQGNILYQNLGLFKESIPGFSGVDSMRALKYAGNNKRTTKKGQYYNGETMGI